MTPKITCFDRLVRWTQKRESGGIDSEGNPWGGEGGPGLDLGILRFRVSPKFTYFSLLP